MPGIDGLSMGLLLVLIGIVAMAGLVHGALGLGFPMVATPLLALITDVRSAILITLLPTVAVNVISILRGGNWSQSIGRHWPLAFFVPLGALVGTWVILNWDPAPFALLLAALMVLYLNLGRLRIQGLDWVKQHRALAYLGFGLLAGFSAGTVNVMVPLLIILTLELGLAPTAMVQVFNLCFLMGKLTQIWVFMGFGQLSAPSLMRTWPLVLAAVLALLLGMTLRKRLEAGVYRRAVRWILGGLAGLLTAQYLWRFL